MKNAISKLIFREILYIVYAVKKLWGGFIHGGGFIQLHPRSNDFFWKNKEVETKIFHLKNTLKKYYPLCTHWQQANVEMDMHCSTFYHFKFRIFICG